MLKKLIMHAQFGKSLQVAALINTQGGASPEAKLIETAAAEGSPIEIDTFPSDSAVLCRARKEHACTHTRFSAEPRDAEYE